MFYLDRTIGIESRSVSASTTSVTYTFDAFRNRPLAVLLLIDLQQAIPDGTGDDLPILFGNVPLLASNGEQVTVGDIGGAGATALLLAYFNSRTGRLQLVNFFPEAAGAATAEVATTNSF